MSVKKRMNARSALFYASCVGPALALYCILYVAPSVGIFSTSLFEWSGLDSAKRFVGLENFRYLFASDPHLIKSFGNTLKLMLLVPIPTLLLALLSAAALARKDLAERNFYRVVFFLPSILSFVVISILWSVIFNPNMGLVNSLLRVAGLGGLARPWLGDERTVLGSLAIIMIWQAFGYYMVMYIAGIDSIPAELYEAAEMDGASEAQQFFNITVPLLWQIIRVTIVFMINGVVVISFTMVSILTNGGPNWASEVALTQMYRQGFTNANFGYAMSISVVVFLFCLVLSLVANRATAKELRYG